MRPIKFRAWDTEEKKMCYDFLSKNWLKVAIKSPHVELMQYTGLKDKNGKEIYEGDLLRYPPTDEWEKTNFVAFEVFYHDNDCADNHVGFQMNRIRFHGSIGGYHIMEKFLPKYTAKMEVIGNIYENPELLGKEE